MIEIKNNKFVINGQETSNPELIGLACLDLLEKGEGHSVKRILDQFELTAIQGYLVNRGVNDEILNDEIRNK